MKHIRLKECVFKPDSIVMKERPQVTLVLPDTKEDFSVWYETWYEEGGKSVSTMIQKHQKEEEQ